MMTASYICKKTLCKNWSGGLQKIELSACIVSDIRNNIIISIWCKILTDQGFRIILDRDQFSPLGVYPRGEKGEYDISKSFTFQSHEDLYVTMC